MLHTKKFGQRIKLEYGLIQLAIGNYADCQLKNQTLSGGEGGVLLTLNLLILKNELELLTGVDNHYKVVKGECWIALMRLEGKKN